MSALEQEIIERLKHLSETAKLHILEAVKHAEHQDDGGFYDDEPIIIEDGYLDGEEWLAGAKALREEMTAKYKGVGFPYAVEMIRELREEES